MKKSLITALSVLLLGTPALAAENLRREALDAGLVPIPTKKAELAKLTGSPDAAQVELGKMLYFDPRLSKSGLISCNSCHNLATGGIDAAAPAPAENTAPAGNE